MEAFRSLLSVTPSADSLRSLALYITYAVHTPKGNNSYFPRSTQSVRRPPHFPATQSRRSTTSSDSPIVGDGHLGPMRTLSRIEMGTKVLELYADILCQKDPSNIKKFARTVTNKVTRNTNSSVKFAD